MGKSLMADPERAPLVRRAFEEYATGRFTKEQLLKQTRAWGLTNRRGRPLTSQAIGTLLRNRLYAASVNWIRTSRAQGRPSAVCEHRAALCAASRDCHSLATPLW
jgi:site-specific DNA recombinase